MTASTAGFTAALANRRFRWLLLLVVAVPIVVQYLGYVVLPWSLPPGPHPCIRLCNDLDIYVDAARMIQAGQDPYASLVAHPPVDFAGNSAYVYPPFWAWLLQPVVGVGKHGRDLVAELLVQACLVVGLLLLARALRAGRQEFVVWLVLAVLFEPWLQNAFTLQATALGFACSACWLATTAGALPEVVGGLALGLEVAIKLFQAPLGLLSLIERRWALVAAAGGMVVLTWAIADPALLYTYVARVLPLQTGTGNAINSAPLGLIMRTAIPASVHGGIRPPLPATLLAAAVSLTVLAFTLAMVRGPRADADQEALKGAALIATVPFLFSVQWYTHLAFLLIPLLVLLHVCRMSRDRRAFGLAVAGWLLLGPGLILVTTLIHSGVNGTLAAYVMGLVGPIGMVVTWSACMVALRRWRPEPTVADR